MGQFFKVVINGSNPVLHFAKEWKAPKTAPFQKCKIDGSELQLMQLTGGKGRFYAYFPHTKAGTNKAGQTLAFYVNVSQEEFQFLNAGKLAEFDFVDNPGDVGATPTGYDTAMRVSPLPAPAEKVVKETLAPEETPVETPSAPAAVETPAIPAEPPVETPEPPPVRANRRDRRAAARK